MHLVSVSVKNLHGFITEDINFLNDLTILVGINGTGKTSILNAIDWIIRFDIQKLASNSFDLIELSFIENGISRTLRATQKKNIVVLENTQPKDNSMAPIVIPLLISPSEISTLPNSKMALEAYERVRPNDVELPLWNYMKSLDKPIIISVDRSLWVEDSQGQFYIDPDSTTTSRNRRRKIGPIEKVKEVTMNRYAQYKAREHQLNGELKSKVITSAFYFPFSEQLIDTHRKGTKKLAPEQLSSLKEKVVDLIKNSIQAAEQKDMEQRIEHFFALAQSFLRRENSAHRQSVYEIFAAQFNQLQELMVAFEEFEKERAKAYSILELFTQSVNSFFRDSGKEIFFSDTVPALRFRGIAQKDAVARDISLLSSGEHQILVLFTFLSFVAQPNSVMIIDEPELSLHPKWQQEFLHSFLRLKPPNTQLILATHSPEFVAGRKDCCQVLGRRTLIASGRFS